MIRKGQMQGVNKGDTPRQALFLAELFGGYCQRYCQLGNVAEHYARIAS